jgi:glycosyltransferase involved in cell wall biosynthesis
VRLLIVGIPPSIHLQRSTEALSDLGWDVHVVPCLDQAWHEGFRDVTLHATDAVHLDAGPDVRLVDRTDALPRHRAVDLRDRGELLASIIDDVRPDIVHAHQMTLSGVICDVAREHLVSSGRPFPRWIVSNWGSDVHLFGRHAPNRAELRRILAHCDAYWCECHRDVGLAWNQGFRGRVLPVLPIAGGFDLDAVRALRTPGPRSRRRAIAVKGYGHWMARGHLLLDALVACGDLLAGRELVVYAGTDDIIERASGLQGFGARVTVLRDVPHDEILAAHGRSRISIGLSLSDGISTSFLEAMAGGSFPIQSRTACADEWIVDGVTGLLVDPDDVRSVSTAIRRALTDDALVDDAAGPNDRTVDARLDRSQIVRHLVAAYEDVLAMPRPTPTAGVVA